MASGWCRLVLAFVLVLARSHSILHFSPPLGVEVISELQEFQEFKTRQSIFKRWRRVAKIKRRKMFDRRAFIMFRTQSPHAQ